MAAFTYEFHVKGLQKNPVEVVGKVLDDLTNSPGGLTDQTLLDASRPEDAPLHNEFEWNDGKAAERYRLIQAQNIIRNVYVVYTNTENERKKDRAYVPIPGGQTAYVTLQSALTNEEWKRNLLASARRDAESFVAKYRRLEELADVNNALTAFLDRED